MTKLLIPTVHLNGTSRQELLDQIGDALHALHNAKDALAKAAPSGRDYYPQGGQATGEASTQHRNRMAQIQDVIRQLETIGEGIADQGGR